jgi:uncharacterized protein YukE
MNRIQVDPAALHSGGSALAGSGSSVKAIRGELAAALAAVGALGDARAAGAYTALCGAWAQALGALDARVEGLGRLMQSAGGAYTATDEAAIPGP